MKELEEDRDALLEGRTEMVPGTLNSLTGEEGNKLFRMLRLEVAPSDEGYKVSGAICTSELPTG